MFGFVPERITRLGHADVVTVFDHTMAEFLHSAMTTLKKAAANQNSPGHVTPLRFNLEQVFESAEFLIKKLAVPAGNCRKFNNNCEITMCERMNKRYMMEF